MCTVTQTVTDFKRLGSGKKTLLLSLSTVRVLRTRRFDQYDLLVYVKWLLKRPMKRGNNEHVTTIMCVMGGGGGMRCKLYSILVIVVLFYFGAGEGKYWGSFWITFCTLKSEPHFGPLKLIGDSPLDTHQGKGFARLINLPKMNPLLNIIRRVDM